MKLVFSLFLILLMADLASGQSIPKVNGFIAPVYQEMPLGSIQPEGWIKHQLQIMRDGTSGHLDEVHNKIKNSNGWLGGTGDAWEETPYWLDGAVPLAWLLDDKILQEKVRKYIDWTIEHQRPSGYFGGITSYERENNSQVTVENLSKAGDDWWPKMVMLKVMQQYYQATGDQRVIEFMTRYFQFQLKALTTVPLGKWTEWATSRGTDNVLMVQWLYQITKDKSLLELAAMIESQSFQWSEWMGNRDWVIWAATYQNEDRWMHRHGVNVGMAIKSPAVNYQRTGDKKYLEDLKTGFTDLMTLHGLPMGIYSADEDLHGNDPTQGVELCAIVESMYSLEQIVGITGDPFYMDALERMTFNALPPQTTDDYNNKQYFQIANQVQISRGVFNFSLPFDREMNNVLGMRSGYTCCLANMHQGWTKFASHLWYRNSRNGIAALAFSPNTLKTKVGASHTEIEVRENTNYPFDEKIQFEFRIATPVEFPFELRIPSWCKEAHIMINGKNQKAEKGGQIITINRKWSNQDLLEVEFPMEMTTSNWGKNSRAIERGPLVYALKVKERWEKGHQETEGDYFSVFPESAWNYGILQEVVNHPMEMLKVKSVKPVDSDFIWNLEHAPLEITVPGKQIPGWKAIDGIAYQPVTTREGVYKGMVVDKIEQLTLVPIGCTKVRIVAFPVVR
ncbi:MAG TPA: beta-L-arabinofuranosidase domain-containing protein [Prolixibacteraceae bacterium]|jgi:DUF1680 family protein